MNKMLFWEKEANLIYICTKKIEVKSIWDFK